MQTCRSCDTILWSFLLLHPLPSCTPCQLLKELCHCLMLHLYPREREVMELIEFEGQIISLK